jgi:2-dehydropantoate 2-reductase
MNGVDSEEIIARRFGRKHLIHCVALGMDAVRKGSEVNYTTPGEIVAGRAGSESGSIKDDPDLCKLKAVCDAASFQLEIRDDILKALWWKFMINIGVNQVSAITGTSYGFFQDRGSHAHALMNAAMQEVIQVAQMKNIDLSDKDITAWYSVLDRLGAEGKTSMLQDMEAGRKTEVEMFAGILLNFGEELGLELPVNRILFQVIRSREAAAGIR